MQISNFKAYRQYGVLINFIPIIIAVLMGTTMAKEHPLVNKKLTFLFTAMVVEVIDGDTIRLHDGQQVRLVGIQAPKLSLGRPNFIDWPKAEDAKSLLEKISLNKKVSIYLNQQLVDPHQRLLAHVVTEDGFWLQEEMLMQGMARVYSFPDNRRLIKEMLTIEEKARHRKIGIWSDPYYAIQNVKKVGPLGSFQVVEGQVVGVSRNRDTIYINFDQDWRQDFTLEITLSAKTLFDMENIDVFGLLGRWVRVRGWIENKNGPMIELTHPEQLELLK